VLVVVDVLPMLISTLAWMVVVVVVVVLVVGGPAWSWGLGAGLLSPLGSTRSHSESSSGVFSSDCRPEVEVRGASGSERARSALAGKRWD